ncbi:MAG: tRNA (guanosine(46)-N7)-methyltransferase TrmB [Phycisphaerales bacterium]
MTHRLSRGKQSDTQGYGLAQSELPPFEDGWVDPGAWFDRPDLPLQVEIGSGKGTFLVQQAPRHPDVNYLGIERAPEFYRYAADRVRRHALPNVRMLHGDAVEFIRFWCADEVVAVLHLYFSDPWPKSRHHKRRVVQDAALNDFHRIMIPGAALHLVTDHEQLWQWYEEHATRHSHRFERRPFDPVESASAGELVGSNFERKYKREGRLFRGMTLVKRS